MKIRLSSSNIIRQKEKKKKKEKKRKKKLIENISAAVCMCFHARVGHF